MTDLARYARNSNEHDPASLVYLVGVSHFAPLQRPDLFDSAIQIQLATRVDDSQDNIWTLHLLFERVGTTAGYRPRWGTGNGHDFIAVGLRAYICRRGRGLPCERGSRTADRFGARHYG